MQYLVIPKHNTYHSDQKVQLQIHPSTEHLIPRAFWLIHEALNKLHGHKFSSQRIEASSLQLCQSQHCCSVFSRRSSERGLGITLGFHVILQVIILLALGVISFSQPVLGRVMVLLNVLCTESACKLTGGVQTLSSLLSINSSFSMVFRNLLSHIYVEILKCFLNI